MAPLAAAIGGNITVLCNRTSSTASWPTAGFNVSLTATSTCTGPITYPAVLVGNQVNKTTVAFSGASNTTVCPDATSVSLVYNVTQQSTALVPAKYDATTNVTAISCTSDIISRGVSQAALTYGSELACMRASAAGAGAACRAHNDMLSSAEGCADAACMILDAVRLGNGDVARPGNLSHGKRSVGSPFAGGSSGQHPQ